MPDRFLHPRTVEFSETDMAGIVHFARFFHWMEAAEAAFFASLDVPLIAFDGNGSSGWPRVRASCDYHEPVFFGDAVEVHLFVYALKVRAIEYRFKFWRMPQARPVYSRPATGDSSPVLAASGKLTTVYVERESPDAPMASRTIPAPLLSQLQEAEPAAIKLGLVHGEAR